MSAIWDRKKHPCKNLFCRINIKGHCDAGHMMSLLCSGEDIYQDCKERIYGEKLIVSLSQFSGIDFFKDHKNNLFGME